MLNQQLRVELTVNPPVNVMSAVPNVSPTLTFAKSNDPASDVKTEVADISFAWILTNIYT